MKAGDLCLGIIGLDTSHVSTFSQILNVPSHPYHVPGGRITVAWGEGSPDFPLSYERTPTYTKELRENYGVTIVDSPESVAAESDAILLESVDGRVHAKLFERIVAAGKPVFVDKPLAVTTSDAVKIASLARRHGIPLMSCSSLRFAEGLVLALTDPRGEPVIGADFYSPMSMVPALPGFFWYGIHGVEMLYAALGRGCRQVSVTTCLDHDMIVGEWNDGRIGSVRGNRTGNDSFGGVIHRDKSSRQVDVSASPKPYYACLLERVIHMFKTGEEPIDLDETLEIVRFLEAANESRASKKATPLAHP